jgi:hypothetical protein
MECIEGYEIHRYHPVCCGFELIIPWRLHCHDETCRSEVTVLLGLTFVGSCSIAIYFYSKTNQMHNISNLFHSWNNTVQVSDGLSVRHRESKTVRTASGIRHICSVAAC